MSKRKKKRFHLKILNTSLLFISIIVLIIVSYIIITSQELPSMFSDKNNQKQIQTIPTIEEHTYTASMIMVGDNLIHSSIYKDANKNANYNGYDFNPMLEYIKPIVQEYDIAYYNQETILGGTELGVSDYPTFNSPQEAGDAMIDAGFNLVSLATNHTMDRGEKAALKSREYWNNHPNILAVGSYSSFEEKETIDIREVNNITYTMLNYTYGTNGMPVPKGKEYLVNVWPYDLDINDPNRDTKYQSYKDQVKQAIEKVRNQVDILIVAMHWGVEYTHTPTTYQQDAAQFLADLDVDIIIGTHPHVIQPVTFIDDTLVIYSLGNFISAQYQDNNYNKMVGLMTNLTITKHEKGDEVEVSIGNVCNELIYTYYKSWRNFKVVPFSNITTDYLPSYENVYERYKAIVQKYDQNMCVKPLGNQ